jgi:hypothetical protein
MSRLARLLPLASLLLLAACPGDGPGEEPDGGTELIPDPCNSREEALSLAECELTPGQQVERYISFPGDQDWYSVRMPPTANARTLVRVTAGYLAQSTAVNLAVSLLREDGQVSLARQVDDHGQGAPRPVEIIIPFTEPNARLLLLLGDEPAVPSRPQFDARSPYFVKVEVLDNPDANEPNNTPAQATPLTLNPQGAVQVGTATGYLATAGDVDMFSFTVEANKVAYLRLTAPELRPAAAYRLSYELRRPDGTNEAEGRVLNATIAADLATARKVKATGTWIVVVQGYRSPTDTGPAPGDLRLQYSLEVRVMDEEDPQDVGQGNDTIQNALVRTIGAAPGSSTSFTGRIGSVPDPDWYAVDVPASSAPTVLTFRLVEGTGGGRFPPLPGFVDRQVRVLTLVTKGATAADWRVACTSDPTACPKGYGEVPGAQTLVEAYCNSSTTPMCLHASREEEPQRFPSLRNFAGALPVPPRATALRYYFVVQDDGNNWADDRDYTLHVSWLDDPDDAPRYSGGVEGATSLALANDSSGSTFPAPPAGATSFTGQLTHGFGRLRDADRATGHGVRGPADYDAVPSDVDSFILQLPGGLAEPLDRTWALQWQVQHLPDGGLPHGLALDLTFCDGDRQDGGACTPVRTNNRGGPLTLAYRDDALRAWHSESFSGLQPLYSRQVSGSATTFTVLPYACACLEPRFIRGGTVRVDVTATERTSYERVNYTVRTAYTDYPKSYAVDGGTAVCPAPTQDGGTPLPDGGTSWVPGCRFTFVP